MASKKNSNSHLRTEMSPHNTDKRITSEPSPNKFIKGIELKNNNVVAAKKFNQEILSIVARSKRTSNLKSQIIRAPSQNERSSTPKSSSGNSSFFKNPLVDKTNMAQQKKSEYKKISINLHKELQEDKENRPITQQSPSMRGKIQCNESMKKISNIPSEQQTEIKLVSQTKQYMCSSHPKKSIKYEIENRECCSICLLEYAIQRGLPIKICHPIERKLLTFGQDDEYDIYEMLNLEKEITKVRAYNLQGDAAIKQNYIEKFLRHIADVRKESTELQLTLKNEPTRNERSIQETLKYLTEIILSFVPDTLMNKNQSQATIRELEYTLSKYIKETQCIKRDILENLDNIVKCMELEPFQVILSKYAEKLQVIQENHNQIKKKISQMAFHEIEIINKIKSNEFNKNLENFLINQIISEQKSEIRHLLSPQSMKLFELVQKNKQNQSNNSMFFQTLTSSSNQLFETTRENSSQPIMRNSRYQQELNTSPHFNR